MSYHLRTIVLATSIWSACQDDAILVVSGQHDIAAVFHFVFAEVEGDDLRLHAIDSEGVEFDSVRVARFAGASL